MKYIKLYEGYSKDAFDNLVKIRKVFYTQRDQIIGKYIDDLNECLYELIDDYEYTFNSQDLSTDDTDYTEWCFKYTFIFEAPRFDDFCEKLKSGVEIVYDKMEIDETGYISVSDIEVLPSSKSIFVVMTLDRPLGLINKTGIDKVNHWVNHYKPKYDFKDKLKDNFLKIEINFYLSN